jgi:hypothetical protein
MADPIAHELLADEATRQEALEIYEENSISCEKSDENAALMATAWLFEDLCEEQDIDPLNALCQLLDIERPVMTEDA